MFEKVLNKTLIMYRSLHSQMFFKKGILKNFAKFPEFEIYNFIKKRGSGTGVFL